MQTLLFSQNDDSAHIRERSRRSDCCPCVVSVFLLLSCLGAPAAPAKEPTKDVRRSTLARQETVKLPVGARTVDLSPDGKWMCCWVNAKEGDNVPYFLWVSPTKRVRWQRVAAGGGMGHWRPDSKLYVFETGYSTSGTRTSGLRVLSVPNKRVQSWWLPFYNVTSPAWSPDGKSIVAFGDQVLRYDKAKKVLPPTKPVGGGIYYERLLLISSSGKLIHHYPNGMRMGQWSYESPTDPRWSMDGRNVAYLRRSGDYETGPILVFDVKRHSIKELGEEQFDFAYSSVRWIGNRVISNNLLPEGLNVSPSEKPLFLRNTNHTQFIATILDVLPTGKSKAYFAIQQDGPVPYGELWQGQLSPYPRLIKRLATFPLVSSYPYQTTVFFEAKRRRLWVMSPTSNLIRSVPVEGPYTSLKQVSKPNLPQDSGSIQARSAGY